LSYLSGGCHVSADLRRVTAGIYVPGRCNGPP